MTALTMHRYLSAGFDQEALRRDVREGLALRPRTLRPRWFYDARGSELFEQITGLPEYYPTRSEREILLAQAERIALATGAGTLIDLGSGSSEKTRILLAALRATGTLHLYVPVDVSESALVDAAETIGRDDGLEVQAVLADFSVHLGRLPRSGRRLVALLGGTIGNLDPAERAVFLAEVRRILEPGDSLLLGTDLVKDPAVLVAAYDDAAGVTAEFNLNVLQVLNRELGADFDPAAFSHVARWNAEEEWIEMRLRSRRRQLVRVPGADLEVPLLAGEEIRTEISAKFRPARVGAELAAAGFRLAGWWTDRAGRFGLSLSTPA